MARAEQPDFTAKVDRGIARGLEVYDAIRQALDTMPTGSGRALQRQARAVNKASARSERLYLLRIRRSQTAVVAGTSTAIVGLGVGTIDVLTAGALLGTPVGWLALAGLGGGAAVWGRRSRRRIGSPPPAPRVAPALPRGAVGSDVVERYLRTRLDVITTAHQIQRLHPDAAHELLSADAEAGVALDALVERMRVLDQLARSPSPAAAAARESGAVIAERLARGCDSYDSLLQAATRLLAAPDLSRTTDAILQPAVDALIAYAHGLTKAAQI